MSTAGRNVRRARALASLLLRWSLLLRPFLLLPLRFVTTACCRSLDHYTPPSCSGADPDPLRLVLFGAVKGERQDPVAQRGRNPVWVNVERQAEGAPERAGPALATMVAVSSSGLVLPLA